MNKFAEIKLGVEPRPTNLLDALEHLEAGKTNILRLFGRYKFI
jgi:hypothetical protein